MQDPGSERPARKRDAIGSCHRACLNCISISNAVHCLLLLACTVILVLAPTILSGCLCRQAVMVARPAPSQQVCWKPFERSKETWSQQIPNPHHSCLQYDTQYDIPQPDCTIESPCKLPSSLNNVTDLTNCRTYSDCNSGPFTVYESLTSAEQRQPDAEVGSYTHHQTFDHPPTAHTKGRSPHTNTANTPQHIKTMAQQCEQAESRTQMASNVGSANLTANAVVAQVSANRCDSVSVKQTSWTWTRSHTRSHPTHLQCTTIRALQQFAPARHAYMPTGKLNNKARKPIIHFLPKRSL